MFFNVYMLLIVVRCLLTWFPNLDWNNSLLNGLRAAVDLYLDLFRKIIPPVGPFDFSPVVAMFVLIIIERPIIWLFAQVFSLAGLLG
ncbi:YggT family protein [bacterium]|nr:YggT family protein [bacterium]